MSRRLLQKLIVKDCLPYSIEALFSKTDQVGTPAVIGCIDPKYSAWKYFLPLADINSALVFETGFGIDTLAVAPLADRVITVCDSTTYAEMVRARLDTESVTNVLVIVATIWEAPFDDSTFDLIIARDSVTNMGDKNNWRSCRIYLGKLKRVLSQQGIALVGTESFNIWEIKRFFNNTKGSGNVFLLSLCLALLQFNNKETFHCSTEHFLFDEIIFKRKSYKRNNTFTSIKDCIKEIIIQFLFPVGAASGNYIIRKNKEMKVTDSLFDKIITAFPASLREDTTIVIRRIYIGNPCTILCLVTTGLNSYFLRIPMSRIAATRVEQQFQTLHSFPKTFSEKHHLPEVFPCYTVADQPVYIEKALTGIVVEDKKFIRRFHEDMAVDWLIRLHKETRSDAYTYIQQAKDSVQQTFTKLAKQIQSQSDALLLSHIQKNVLDSYSRIVTETVCMHGDYKIENMIFSTDMKKINGVFDWDLSQTHGLPVVDLYYFIVYSSFLRNPSTTISELFCKKFLDGSLANHEQQWLNNYSQALDIHSEQRVFFMILTWLNHIVYRAGRFNFSNAAYYDTCVHTVLAKITATDFC